VKARQITCPSNVVHLRHQSHMGLAVADAATRNATAIIAWNVHKIISLPHEQGPG
jgi:hypothetical protein